MSFDTSEFFLPFISLRPHTPKSVNKTAHPQGWVASCGPVLIFAFQGVVCFFILSPLCPSLGHDAFCSGVNSFKDCHDCLFRCMDPKFRSHKDKNNDGQIYIRTSRPCSWRYKVEARRGWNECPTLFSTKAAPGCTSRLTVFVTFEYQVFTLDLRAMSSLCMYLSVCISFCIYSILLHSSLSHPACMLCSLFRPPFAFVPAIPPSIIGRIPLV